MTTAEVAAPTPAQPSESALRERWPRASLIVASVVLLGLPLVVALGALATRRWYPVLDLAMTEFRLRDVGQRDTPLIGLPGRIGDLPDQGSHPGPLSFWLLAPTYRIFGSSAWAMEAATVVLQLVWISLSLWIGHRRLGTAGVAMIGAVVAVLIRGFGLSVLTQPWNPYLPLIAWLVVLLATWSVLCGDHVMLIPLVFAASFAAQTHIPYLTMAGGLGVVAIGVTAVRWWSDGDRGPVLRPIVLTVGLFAVLWIGPVVDQIRRTPGNVSRLIDHFGSPPEEAIGVASGARLLLRHLDVVDGFARLLTGDERFLAAGFEPDGAVWPGVLVLAAWVAAAVAAVRVGHGALVRLHLVLGTTLVLSLASMSRIFGLRWFYLTLWAWVTTTLMLAAILWTAAVVIRERTAGRQLTRGRLTIAASLVAALTTLAMVVLAPTTDHPEEYLGETVGAILDPTTVALDDGVGGAAGADGVYAVSWTDAYFFGSQAFGLVNELEREGYDARVYPNWRVPATPERTIGSEPVTAEIVFATGGFVERWRADDRVTEVATFDPRTDAERAEFADLRRELIAVLRGDGLDDLVTAVDLNLFGVGVDERVSAKIRELTTRMLTLGVETAVFIGPPGVSLP